MQQSQQSGNTQAGVLKRQAVLTIDKSLSSISIMPESQDNIQDGSAEGLDGLDSILEKGTMFRVDRIQLVCPATDAKLVHDVIARRLSDDEKPRAVVLEYAEQSMRDFGPVRGPGGGSRHRLFLLEESEGEKDVFVNALTSLWLERRNDHSMWF